MKWIGFAIFMIANIINSVLVYDGVGGPTGVYWVSMCCVIAAYIGGGIFGSF